MADKSIKVAVILSAVDKMSSVIKKANETAKAAFDFGKTSAIASASLAAPLIYATSKAIDFEEKMADVAKVYNTKIGDSTFLQLGEQAKDLSEYLSNSAEESASLMASLGQGGVAQAELDKVSKTAGQMAVAFDLSAEIAGDSYTKLKNALNSTWEETAKIGDAINYLSDNQASKASEILTFMASGGAGVAKASKAAGKDLAAMGSYLISVGKSGEESATIIERFYKGIMKNNGTRGMFLKAGEGTAGFISILQKGANIKDPGKKFEYFKQFGEYSSEIMSMAGNMDQLRDSIKSVGDETSFAGSIQKEFINRNSTTKGKIGKSWAEFNRIILDFGAHGLPIITKLLDDIRPVIKSIGQFMSHNKNLTATIFGVVGGASVLALGLSGLSFAFGGVMKIVSITTGAYRLFKVAQIAYMGATVAGTAVTGGFTAAMTALNLAFLANPVFLIVAGIAALTAGIIYCYNEFETFRAGMDGLMEVGKQMIDIFVGLGKVLYGAFTLDWDMIKQGAKQAAVATGKIVSGYSFNQGYDASMATSKAELGSTIAARADAAKGAAKVSGGLSGALAPAPLPQPNKPLYSSMTFAPVIHLSGSATGADGRKIVSSIKDEFKKAIKENDAHQKRVAY